MEYESELHAIQAAFSAALVDGEHIPEQGLLRERGLTARQRLNVYYNHSRIVQLDALQAIYPAVCRLLGNEFFSGMAAIYGSRFPLVRGDLRSFGEHLAELMDTFEPLESLPYIADVARLEWACHESLHSGLPVSPTPMTSPSTIALAPHVRLLRSAFPVAEIWDFALRDHDADGPGLNIADAEPSHTLVMRPHLDVEVYTLPAEDWDWLAGFGPEPRAADEVCEDDADRCTEWLRNGALAPYGAGIGQA